MVDEDFSRPGLRGSGPCRPGLNRSRICGFFRRARVGSCLWCLPDSDGGRGGVWGVRGEGDVSL